MEISRLGRYVLGRYFIGAIATTILLISANSAAHALTPGQACNATGPDGKVVPGVGQQQGAFVICVPINGGVNGASQTLAKYIAPNKYYERSWVGGGDYHWDGYDLDKYIRDHPNEFQGMGVNPRTFGGGGIAGQEQQSGPTGIRGTFTPDQPAAGGAQHLGVYIYAPDYLSQGLDGFGGGAAIRNSGVSVTDSAGTLAAGTLSPSFRAAAGNGGVGATVDATRYFGLPGSLLLRGTFDYQRVSQSFGTNTPLATAGVLTLGSVTRDAYTFTGLFEYDANDAFYVKGGADFGFGNGSAANNATGGTGSFTNDNYSVGVKVGKVFTLIDTLAARPTAIVNKAPAGPVAGGYVFGIDLSGGVGYVNWRDNGFTDSSGFIFGAEQVHFGDVNGRAKLFAIFPGSGFLWMPYVAGTVDQRFSFSHTFTVPAQAASIADTFIFNDATTYLGTQFGFDARAPNGWIVGAKGFYSASADTNITGGSAYIRIPFSYLPFALAQRY